MTRPAIAVRGSEHLDLRARFRRGSCALEGQVLMLIGELADPQWHPPKTIRYYESIGLLDLPARTASGYRAYEPDASGRLGFIRAAQAAGLTLGEIRRVVALRDPGETPCAHVLSLLTARQAQIDRRIAELPRGRRRTSATRRPGPSPRPGGLRPAPRLPSPRTQRLTVFVVLLGDGDDPLRAHRARAACPRVAPAHRGCRSGSGPGDAARRQRGPDTSREAEVVV